MPSSSAFVFHARIPRLTFCQIGQKHPLSCQGVSQGNLLFYHVYAGFQKSLPFLFQKCFHSIRERGSRLAVIQKVCMHNLTPSFQIVLDTYPVVTDEEAITPRAICTLYILLRVRGNISSTHLFYPYLSLH